MLILAAGFTAAVTSGVVAWRIEGPHGERGEVDPRVHRIYDAKGRLTVIAFDSDGDLKFDTWSHMDGGRQVRIDVDDDGDGAVDRRKSFGTDEKVERIEYLDKQGHVTRTDWYRGGVVQRSESKGQGR
jgi:hypothetical protein